MWPMYHAPAAGVPILLLGFTHPWRDQVVSWPLAEGWPLAQLAPVVPHTSFAAAVPGRGDQLSDQIMLVWVHV